MDFEAREDVDGVRLSWNTLPKSKLQHQRNVIPLASMYTPLNNKSPQPCPLADKSQILRCRQCFSFLNPYVVANSGVWYCQFCEFGNVLEQDANGNFPLSINPDSSTIEYVTGRLSKFPPIFFYVVDTCFEVEDVEDAYQSLKESLLLSLSQLPENALVGFISYGKHVQIHEINPMNGPKIHTFNGNKDYNLEQLQKSLGILLSNLKHQSESQLFGPIADMFLLSINMAEYQISSIIESLVTNTFPHHTMKQRPLRATGSALNIASLLLTSILGNHGTTGGHILTFVAGACTYGPGKIVGEYLKEPMRSHHDIDRSNKLQLPSVPNPITSRHNTKVDFSLVTNAKKFYKKITSNLVKLGLSCNFFIGSYDQVGLYEMDEVCYKTGGVVIMSDSFNTSIFKQSFIKFFQKQQPILDDNDENQPEEGEYLDMGFNATLEVRTSKDLQIQGLIGNATSLPYNKSNRYIEQSVSSQPIGESNTNSWKLFNVNPQSTYAIYFDKLDSSGFGATFIQYIFHYQHPSGELRLKVTTIPLSVIADSDLVNLESGFDQETALVILARDAINKLQLSNNPDTTAKTVVESGAILKQLDKILVDFCTRFAIYTKGRLESFKLSSTYAMLPQFMYHLRRSQFIQVFNNSPDETSYVRHVFMHEDVTNSLIMIQPSLLSYDVDTYGSVDETTGEVNNDPEPVLLDSMSLGSQKILLLDTFFQILIYHGSKVTEWRKANYHNLEGYEYFKAFLEAPKREAMEILMDRFPLPRFIDCDEGGSQARFLMAKLNPSTSYATNPNHMYGSSINTQLDVLTDDISLQLYMDHIQRIVIAKK